MNFKISLSSAGVCAAALTLIVVGWSAARAAGVDPNIDITGGVCHAQPQIPQITYGAKPGEILANTPVLIGVKGASGNVFWALSTGPGCPAGDPNTLTLNCGPNAANAPAFQVQNPDTGSGIDPTGAAGQVKIVNFPGSPPLTSADIGREGTFGVSAAPAPSGNPLCQWNYRVHVVNAAAAGGWGDPHMTTVDGVHYDFQSAGEFTALRSKDFEVQTRQRPVSTTTVPGPSEYTGLAVCVATYSAVAVRIGSNRVTLQPNLRGRPDPEGLQLRVNGKLVTLTAGGIDLRAGGSSDPKAQLEGRIVRAPGNGYEFVDVFGTQLVATPAYWVAQQTWYLNLNVFQTSASRGIWGRLASDSWLPALPDGTPLGPRPASLSDRYAVLYEKFADAWRVTDSTSLFDYAPGTNTKTFTRAEWPRFDARSCEIDKQPPAQPATPQVAERACRAIANEAQRADCIFDVTVTGETGFARTYRTMQEFKPHGTGWQPVLAGGRGKEVPKPDRRR